MANPLRVFIAEDEAIILDNFVMRIEKMGHIVVGIALDGYEAKEKIAQLKPDLILMDINMPHQDGLSVMEEINKDRVIPCIIITGHYSAKLIERANQAGVFGYLIKPVDEKQLEATVNIVQTRYSDFQQLIQETENMKNALEDRKFIEKAKGILMDRFMLKEVDAMKQLQKQSKDKNKKLVVVAKEIIAAEKLLNL